MPLRSGPVDPATGRARRFAYPPNLVVVDGGPPQVAAAQRVLDDLGIEDVALVGLAKRLEEVWVPGDEFPVVLPRTSPALYLLQHLRDESHRFAITHHRSRRAKAMTRSVLDGVPGLGPTRQAALLKAFGSVKNIRAASVGGDRGGQGRRPAHRPGRRSRRSAARRRPRRRPTARRPDAAGAAASPRPRRGRHAVVRHPGRGADAPAGPRRAPGILRA